MGGVDPVKMVDISPKAVVHREAEAVGRIILRPETLKAVREGAVKKGDPLTVAEVASIQAVKRTAELIPLCHPIPVTSIQLHFTVGEDHIEVRCRVVADYKTGVEMEALTGVAVALLTIWDMVKYLEKDERGQYPHTRIAEIKVVEKLKG
ncbi:MAG: molybdenum cofactor biosynthesis protein MoaC [Candidatus Bathyarchaeota archaeon B23]|nr:MAG: molybdenum cofactor biosynthesis protein MoaC [Candidatus Bathyarchaeota archaeon B23]